MLTELLWKIFLAAIGLTIILKFIFTAKSVLFLFGVSYLAAFVVFILIIQIEAIVERIRNKKKGRKS